MNGLHNLNNVAYEENGIITLTASPSPVVIRDAGSKGRGVFAVREIKKGEVAIVGKPVSRGAERTWLSVQWDADTHLRMDEPFEVVNHSCDPNCGIKVNQFEGYNLVAMRDIEAGEEITFDYCMTEWVIGAFTACHCQSEHCREMIYGGSRLSAEVMKKYEGYTAPYYQSLEEEIAGDKVP